MRQRRSFLPGNDHISLLPIVDFHVRQFLQLSAEAVQWKLAVYPRFSVFPAKIRRRSVGVGLSRAKENGVQHDKLSEELLG